MNQKLFVPLFLLIFIYIIFNNYLNSSDFINAFTGELGYDFETEQNNLEFYYTGFFNRYYEYADKSTVYRNSVSLTLIFFPKMIIH
ncbi:MAG: hypothetical protein P8X47_04910 [Ignavibacteriaceae bacterium]